VANKKQVSVKVQKGNIQKALRLFKRRMEDSGHLQLLREKQTYTKPTTVRRREKQLAVRAQNKLTLLEKIEGGDTSIRIFQKKKKKGSRRK
jgi:ribosomal protein S21|tara:strand:- start:2236 stop:2508 length:273 start_codon:yes stop_codon:yes gene_type:complete